MRSLKRLMEKLLADWLQPVVDVETHEPPSWPGANSQPIPMRFAVLTPSVQRALDRSA
jgi:hypothetical protein